MWLCLWHSHCVAFFHFHALPFEFPFGAVHKVRRPKSLHFDSPSPPSTHYDVIVTINLPLLYNLLADHLSPFSAYILYGWSFLWRTIGFLNLSSVFCTAMKLCKLRKAHSLTIQWFLLLTRCHIQPLVTLGHSWLEIAPRERQKPFLFLTPVTVNKYSFFHPSCCILFIQPMFICET